MNTSIKEYWIEQIHKLQDTICLGLEEVDGIAKFYEDAWERTGGGGGKTRVISNGRVFEKGGVNTSVVFGEVTPVMRSQLASIANRECGSWFACGLSLVIHPFNPFVPTVHANYRMFELYDKNGNCIDSWFGGGTDLTPYYLFKEDVVYFHTVYKKCCDEMDPTFYPVFKKACDDYFVNHHRKNERRGVGGIFYDYQRPSDTKSATDWMQFAMLCGHAFLEAYLPIVQRRKDTPFTPENKYWQEIRRGRYTEFNLVHDRGTIFGLKTEGRTESILMSLPPTVRFDYNYQPKPNSEEQILLTTCLHPVEWIAESVSEVCTNKKN
jgi:coproporphyrinogen III oxidase